MKKCLTEKEGHSLDEDFVHTHYDTDMKNACYNLKEEYLLTAADIEKETARLGASKGYQGAGKGYTHLIKDILDRGTISEAEKGKLVLDLAEKQLMHI